MVPEEDCDFGSSVGVGELTVILISPANVGYFYWRIKKRWFDTNPIVGLARTIVSSARRGHNDEFEVRKAGKNLATDHSELREKWDKKSVDVM
jgi:hypothetical protein